MKEGQMRYPNLYHLISQIVTNAQKSNFWEKHIQDEYNMKSLITNVCSPHSSLNHYRNHIINILS